MKKKNDLITQLQSQALTQLEPDYGSFCNSSTVEISKQSFDEIEQIISASQSYYNNFVHMQGAWPDRRIIIRRGIALQATQQFDNKMVRQLKYEYMEIFREITALRAENQALREENEQLKAGAIEIIAPA